MEMETAVFFILMVYGICNVFCGYELYRFWIGVSGFFIGALLGTLIGSLSGESSVAVLGAIIVGALGVWLSIALWKIGVFLQCFCYGFVGVFIPLLLVQLSSSGTDVTKIAVNLLLGNSMGMDFAMPLVLALIMGIIVGILGLIFTRIIIIFTSGITGSFVLTFAPYMLLGGEIVGLGGRMLFAIIIAFVGITIQIITTSKANKNKVASKPAVVMWEQEKKKGKSVMMHREKKNLCVNSMQHKETGTRMFCSQCGTELKSGTKFCIKCGSKLASK